MKRLLAAVMLLAALTGCAGKNNTPADSENGVSVISVSELEIDISDILKAEHIHHAQVEELMLSDEDKAALSEWLGGLTFERRSYPVGETPGDSDGGEVYTFTFSDGELSYVNNGMDDRFLLYGSDWYALIDPDELPIKS